MSQSQSQTTKPEPARPSFVTDEHLIYLDDLRASGATNMFGAGPYLIREFGLSRAKSHKVLTYWMETFSARHRDRDPEEGAR